MSTSSVTATINTNINARGLAIIVTNDYKDTTMLSPLSGTVIDGENMKKSFLELGFAVHWTHNISNEQFTELIHEASSFQEYQRFNNYKCIVFVFSGHGDLGDIVYLQDSSEVSIGEDIIQPFLPKTSPLIGKLQKLFFFDACRGKQESRPVAVPKGSRPRGKYDDSPAFDSRGGLSIERIRVPEEGGFLVAYSTMSNCLAWEERKGGAWLQRLATEIRTNTSSIEDVLTKVNSDMVDDQPDKIQQPEKLSRLNKVVFLHPKEAEKGALSSPAMKKLMYPLASIKDISDNPYNPPEYPNVTFYRTQVTISIPGREDLTGDSGDYFRDIQESREKSIQDALSKLQPQQALIGHSASESSDRLQSQLFDQLQALGIQYQPASVSTLGHAPAPQNQSHCSPVRVAVTKPSQHGYPKPTQQALPPPQPKPTQQALPLPQGGNYKQLLNHFFQENGIIDPKYDYYPVRSDCASGFRCIIRYQLHGVAKEVDSERYYISKTDAKEEAAKLLLMKENVSPIISKGSKGATPPSKVWKSKLKEYCDKQRVVSEYLPSYRTVSSVNGFKSTVTVIGRVFEGDECKSKQEAEQSAAQCAMKSV